MKIRLIAIIITLCWGKVAPAQIINPVEWHLPTTIVVKDLNEPITLIFLAKLDPNWLMYSNIQNYGLGPLPAEFQFEPSSSHELVGNMKAIGTKRKYDDVFEVYVNYFEHDAEFQQQVKVLSKNPVIRGTYTYQICSMVDGTCRLESRDFQFNIQLK